MTTNAFLLRCNYIKSITQWSSSRNAVSRVLLHLQTSSLMRSGTMGLMEGQGSTRSIIHISVVSQSQCHFLPNYKSTYGFGRATELICFAVLPFSPVNELTALSVIKDEVQRCCISAASSSSREKKGEANKLCAMSLPSQATLNPMKQQQ